MSLSPAPDTFINHISRHTPRHKLHRHAQDLNILISALVVEEQHLLVLYPGVFVYALEMRRLVAWVDLQVVEVVDCARRGAGGAGNFE